MQHVDESNHESTIYEVSLLPPQFRVTSKATKTLYDYYLKNIKTFPICSTNDNPFASMLTKKTANKSIFVSSTFRDIQTKRVVLRDFVFPQVDEFSEIFCRAAKSSNCDGGEWRFSGQSQ